MVDVTGKAETRREAVATGSVYMTRETIALIESNAIAKGNVFETARLAGIMAAKKTSALIPLCHQINLSSVSIDFSINKKMKRVDIEATVRCSSQTGVEMEALTAVSIAALTVYDMCKSVDKGIQINNIRLLQKAGGKSGLYTRPAE